MYKVVFVTSEISRKGREIASNLSREDAMDLRKRRNSGLSSGEKRYYGMKYKITKM